MPRGHTKSRYGCRECKQRHIKCDESKPSCVNCTTVKRQCSFHASAPVTPLPLHPVSPHSLRGHQSNPAATDNGTPPHDLVETPHSNHDDHLQTPSSAQDTPCSTQRDTLPDDHFTIVHLQLLHHYQTELSSLLIAQQPQAAPMLRYMVTEALGTPFLMDQVLEVAAAHKHATTRQPDYFLEAANLQSRSMRKFHAAREALGGDALFHQHPLAVLSFSMLVSHSALFFACAAATRHHQQCSAQSHSISASQPDSRDTVTFGTVLDELGTCYMIHGGMADVAKQVIPLVDQDVRDELFGFAGKTILANPGTTQQHESLPQEAAPTDPPAAAEVNSTHLSDDEPPFRELQDLLSSLATLSTSSTSTNSLSPDFTTTPSAKISTRDLETYTETLAVLSKEYSSATKADGIRSRSQRYLSATQHFLVRSPPAYRELFAQRRPEALVIFAYYGVIVHRAGEYWGVGQVAGRVLVKGIEGYLGGWWKEWLRWCVAQVGL